MSLWPKTMCQGALRPCRACDVSQEVFLAGLLGSAAQQAASKTHLSELAGRKAVVPACRCRE